MQDKVAPLKQKVKSKESSKRQQRAAANSREAELQEILSSFRGEINQLREITRQIDEYSQSKRDDSGVTAKVAKLKKQREKRKAEIDVLKPELTQLNNAVNDQERHKKQLQANIDVLQANTRIAELQSKIDLLEREMETIEGVDTVSDKLNEGR